MSLPLRRPDVHDNSASSSGGNQHVRAITPESAAELEDLDKETYDAKDGFNSDALHLRQLHLRDLSASTLSGSEDEAFANEDEDNERRELMQDDGEAHGMSGQEKQPQERTRRIQWTSDEERAVMRKLDRRLVLFLALLYLLSYLDRSNIGNALIAGLPQSLHLTLSETSWILTSFYITYILFEWMTLCYRIFRPSVYIPMCVFFWGLIASLQSVVPNYSALIVLRALLGITEAAFGPGVPFFLSRFFRPEELAYRVGLFISAAPLANSFASSLAWAIVYITEKSRLISPWRALFLIEGFPSLFVALWAWYLIPDSPETTSYLTPYERRIAVTRLPKASSKRSISLHELLQTLGSFTPWLTAAMFLLTNISFSSLPIFLPTILEKSLGFSALSSQALSAPPYLLSFAFLLPITRLSDRLRMRAVPIIVLGLLASLSYFGIAILAHASPSSHLSIILRYALIFPVAIGLFSVVTLIITWTLNNQSSETGKGTGMAVINLVGQCGPLIGVRAFPERDEPGYVRGMAVCGAAMLGVAGVAAALGVMLRKRNRDLDQMGRDGGGGGEGRGGRRKVALEKGWRYIV